VNTTSHRTQAPLTASRLRARDVVAVGSTGLRSRRGRSLLTAIGIAIGIAAMVAVVGISASSRANLLAALNELGTDHLRITPGQTIGGEDATLPVEAEPRLSRLDGVEASAQTESLSAAVYRSDLIPDVETKGLGVLAASTDLADTLGLRMRSGRFLDAATARLPAAVLGSTAAERLGVTAPGTSVWLGDTWFRVIGILEPSPIASDLDPAVLIGETIAAEHFDAEGSPSTVYLRAVPGGSDQVREAAPATADPQNTEEVTVYRPSDALAAEAAARMAFTALLLGLGGVALLVGGVGIANVMVIAVLERRTEIGVRRALGATRRHVRWQFLAEAILQAAIGGVAGVALGAGITVAYASSRDWPIDVPVTGLAGGIAAALIIGALAGLYPASRAARLEPAIAVRAT
jgi:putative ABC transport system permease protein